MSSQPEFTSVTVPARIADLEFTYLRPANFNVVELPNEKPNFDDPTAYHLYYGDGEGSPGTSIQRVGPPFASTTPTRAAEFVSPAFG